MSDINAAIAKIAEGINEFITALAEAAAELAKQANNCFEEFAEVINEYIKKSRQQPQNEPMRAKRPDYKQHIKAATKPPYIRQIRKSTGKRGI